jgi:hypothetical protein
MNRKTITTGGLAAAVLTGTGLALVLGGTGAGAASTTQSFTTHAANHNDTTSVTGTATETSDNGPVWAHDNMNIKFRVTDTGNGTYAVTEEFGGSFQGFADPRAANEGSSDPGGPLASSGSLSGVIHMTVHSTTGPDGKALGSQQDPTTGVIIGMTSKLFPNSTIDVADYSFTYHKVAGADYSQSG